MVYAPLAVLGTPAPIIFWYTSFISVLGVIGHSNVRLQIPSPVHRLLMTPHVHWLHHSIERAVSDSNYANILPLWDVLFGTFSAPERHELVGVGTVDDPVPSGLVEQLLSPFVWSRLTKEAWGRGAGN
jgi:sterol desaturase/sphingolipid hydroxylase (fatty acid hydroxylase superfamily)